MTSRTTNKFSLEVRERAARLVLEHERRLLAEACLEATPPDLIIFDEFQRFRGMLAPAAGDRLGRALLGVGRKKPAMLLLSATPYRLYGESWDGKHGPQAHEELFETIAFLTRNKDTRAEAEQLFASFGEILRAIGDAEGDVIDPLLRERAEATRDRIDALLRPCIARTERPTSTNEDYRTRRTPLPVSPVDLRVFKQFAGKVSDRNKIAASAYWLSVPLPAQALGSRYKIADKVPFEKEAGAPNLRAGNRQCLRRELQRPSSGRMPEQPMVPVAGGCSCQDRGLAAGL